jgi:hypothetical protein
MGKFRAIILLLLLSVSYSKLTNAQSQSETSSGTVENPVDGDSHSPNKLNLSHDLVRLGIASRNLTPDNPSLDASPLFQAALQYVKQHQTRLLTVDHGAYYFLTPQDATAYLRFAALSDLKVDLAGSTINFATAFVQGFILSNCHDVTLTNFHVDFLELPYTQVQLASVDPVGRSLAYTTLPNWMDPVQFNQTPAPPGQPIVLWAVAFRNDSIVPGTSRMHVTQPVASGILQLVQDNTPWTQGGTLSTLEPGDTIVVTERGGQPPVMAFRGDFITISDATVFGASAIAVLLNSVSHSTVDHVRVVPRPGSLISSNADGVHFVDAGPDNHIRHCLVTRTLDDALAIDSLDPGTLVQQSGPRQVTVQRTAFLRFPNSTAVSFVDPATDLELPGGTILSQDPPDSNSPAFNGTVTLTLDRDLPQLTSGSGMAFADRAARGAGSSIDDNLVEEVPFGRGIWIAGAEGVEVARNRIGPSSNGGIVVGQNTTFYPVPPARDILIRDNVVHGSLGPMASGSGTQIAVGAIIVESTNNKNLFPEQQANTNIMIQGNRVVDSGRSGIWVGELDGGGISDNVILRWNRHPELPTFGIDAQTRAQLLQDFTQPLVVYNSVNVRGHDNFTDFEAGLDDDPVPPMSLVMLSLSRKLKRSLSVVVLLAGLPCAASPRSAAAARPAAQNPSVGRVVGKIDGISHDGEQFFISGWACQRGQKASIQIHIYAGSSAGDPSKTVFVAANKANLDSEPAVNRICQDDQGGRHRFLAALPFGYGTESTLFVHGIRVANGVANDAIDGSGKPLRRLDTPEMPFPTPTVPAISGSYRSVAEHPRVFTTSVDLADLVSRINRPTSYSSKRFAQLSRQVVHDLAATNDWDATYTGCFVGPYLYAFSYEPQEGHDAETHAALKLGPNTKAPAGAAVVAARLALYAALVKGGATVPAGSPTPDQAAALAKRILLAWADHGFPRGAHGTFLSLSALSCDKTGKPAQYTGWGLPLHLGRGVVYSVHAQDLLQSFSALSASEEARLNALHSALFDLIRQGYNQALGSPAPACQRFSNGFSNGLAAMLAIARLLDDPHRFNAVLNGNDRSIPLVLPWTRFFDGAIYGESDHPMECYLNTGPDALTSIPGFTTSIVAPGEIQDRYRNSGKLQTFGYPMFTLERLINSAETLRIAGFDAYGYRGNHQQSIEMALQYYACYGKTAGFYKIVTLDNARACPNHEQYNGKIVNGVDSNIVIGAYRLPENPAIKAVEGSARDTASTGAFALDAILFGKWRD